MSDSDSDIMSTPINNIEDDNIDTSNNITSNIMKNYEEIEDNHSIPIPVQELPTHNKNIKINNLNKSNKSNKNNNKFNNNKCNNTFSLMCYIKPAIIVFLILLVFSYPLFDTKILKLIPKTLNNYDNITIFGLFIKALFGSILFSIAYKFI